MYKKNTYRLFINQKIVIRCHSLSLDVPFVCLFINIWITYKKTAE